MKLTDKENYEFMANKERVAADKEMRESSHIECITAIHPNSDAARETPYRNSGADVINMDLSHFGETACRLFRKRYTGRT